MAGGRFARANAAAASGAVYRLVHDQRFGWAIAGFAAAAIAVAILAAAARLSA